MLATPAIGTQRQASVRVVETPEEAQRRRHVNAQRYALARIKETLEEFQHRRELDAQCLGER